MGSKNTDLYCLLAIFARLTGVLKIEADLIAIIRPGLSRLRTANANYSLAGRFPLFSSNSVS